MNTNEQKPTPTPWYKEIDSHKSWRVYSTHQSEGADYKIRDTLVAIIGANEESADLIVRAVNSYEPMQARIQELEKALTMVLHCLRDGIPVEKDDPIHQTLSRVFPELLQSSKQL
jgi:hypothetical protein